MNRIRRKKNENFTTISNTFIKDKNLSLKAKGLLASIMALPDDWDFSIRGLCAIVKESKTAVYNAIEELRNNGYCQHIVIRDEKTKQVITTDYLFEEEPILEKELSQRQKKVIERENQKLNTEKQDTENLNPAFVPQLNNKEIKDLTYKEQKEVSYDTSKSESVREVASQCDSNVISPILPPTPLTEPTWRDSFEVYKSIVLDAHQEVLHNDEFRVAMQRYYPNVDFVLTLELSVEHFWATEEGWENKKKNKRVKNINMVKTLRDNFTRNKVFIPFGKEATPLPTRGNDNSVKYNNDSVWQ